MIKGWILEEDITIVNIYTSNIEAPKYIKQILTHIKGEIDSNKIIVEDFNIPLISMDRLSREKIKKETLTLNDTLDQMDLIDVSIYRTFHPKAAEDTFLSSAHETFSRIDNMLGHKTSLSKFKKIKIISSIFSNHNAMRLEIDYKKKITKNTNTWRLNNMLLNNQWISEEIKDKI